jgi:S-adenosylmethionine:tRNA ribosyltransferase-isomerase
MRATLSFDLPDELNAGQPPERRGLSREDVRLLVIERRTGQIDHSQFGRLTKFLRPGDLLIFNSSRTLPASLPGQWQEPDGNHHLEIRLAEHLPDDSWLALLLCRDRIRCAPEQGALIEFGGGLTARVLRPDGRIPRLWKIRFSQSGSRLIDLIHRLGQPIRYDYVSSPWDLSYYQTVYANLPGSAEMPSAGRAFTWKMLFHLQRAGVDTAFLVLHTGLSSYVDQVFDRQHRMAEEEYEVSATVAEKIQRTQARGGRIIAVGTTVVRALETVAKESGHGICAGRGYTRLRITANYPLRIVDGLLTGLHEPEASHLDLLSAFVSAEQIREAYQEAVSRGYLWHEFGDLNLIL